MIGEVLSEGYSFDTDADTFLLPPMAHSVEKDEARALEDALPVAYR